MLNTKDLANVIFDTVAQWREQNITNKNLSARSKQNKIRNEDDKHKNCERKTSKNNNGERNKSENNKSAEKYVSEQNNKDASKQKTIQYNTTPMDWIRPPSAIGD